MAWERFPRAPIVEAVLDIRTTFQTPPDPSSLQHFQTLVHDRYPTREGRTQFEAEISIGEGTAQQAVRRGPEGFLFRSADRQRTIQVRQDGFTFNWLKPYDRWEAVRDEAHEHWDRYRTAFQPNAVTRLGLRYINRLELPLPFADFRDYLLTIPDVAPGIPQRVSSLFLRLEIPDTPRDLLAIVTEAIQTPITDDRGERLPFVFDIDIVRQATFDPSSPSVWETFEQMRDYKNEIFFKSITERAKEMFR